jgi:hypothetical protein
MPTFQPINPPPTSLQRAHGLPVQFFEVPLQCESPMTIHKGPTHAGVTIKIPLTRNIRKQHSAPRWTEHCDSIVDNAWYEQYKIYWYTIMAQ